MWCESVCTLTSRMQNLRFHHHHHHHHPRISWRCKSWNKTSGPLCVTYSCTVDGAVADSLHCRMICGTVPSSVHAWMPIATAATWSPEAAPSKPLPRQRGRRDRRWSCATTVEHAATVTMQIVDAYVTRCRRPAVAHRRDNVVLCRSYNGKLERRGGSRSALGRTANGAHEEEETRAHSSLQSTRDGRQNLRRTVVGSVAMQANQQVSSCHSPVASAPVMQPMTGGLV